MHKIGFMFNSIDNDDFTFQFSVDRNSLVEEKYLNEALNRITKLVLSARLDARAREKYFELILNQINTGLIIYNEQGVVYQINNACLNLFGVSMLTHLNQLDGVHTRLATDLFEINAGQIRVVKFYDEANLVTLSISCAQITTYDKNSKVVAVTNIAEELDNNEVDSWQRLSRVLTHEIMNALAPITSLSETLLHTDDPIIISKGLGIIGQTASGLTQFVENYRRLIKIPTPDLALVDMKELILREISLFDREIEVEFKTCACCANIDKNLIAQVLVNLLKNGVEAAKDKRIWVVVDRKKSGELFVEVCNDGEEISDELRDNIFVPFFTTKEKGSGIGLSLSRQIMRMHNGALTLQTKPHTAFRMQF